MHVFVSIENEKFRTQQLDQFVKTCSTSLEEMCFFPYRDLQEKVFFSELTLNSGRIWLVVLGLLLDFIS